MCLLSRLHSRPHFSGCILLAVLLLLPASPSGQQPESPYAGQQRRAVKALSEEQIKEYLEGRGMGLARAAELNRLPGPLHVLELKEQLQLTPEQRDQTQQIYDTMHAKATALGQQIVDQERKLDAIFARLGQHDEPSQPATAGQRENRHQESLESIRDRVVELGRLNGELRNVHLSAHLEMRRVLSPAQVQRYVELRGYAGSGVHDPSRHGHAR